MRAGIGWDSHRLVPGRPLVIGGVRIPHNRGEEGHSDGDALIHAVIDALLGPAGLGDIGSNFPPGAEEYRGIDSRVLLRKTAGMLAARGVRIVNIDCVVIIERPRILPHIEEMRRRIGEDLGIPADCITVKAKTAEGLDSVGSGDAVAAQAVALLEESDR